MSEILDVKQISNFCEKFQFWSKFHLICKTRQKLLKSSKMLSSEPIFVIPKLKKNISKRFKKDKKKIENFEKFKNFRKNQTFYLFFLRSLGNLTEI